MGCGHGAVSNKAKPRSQAPPLEVQCPLIRPRSEQNRSLWRRGQPELAANGDIILGKTQALWVERSRRALFPAVFGTGRASLGVRCRDYPDMANLPGDRCQAVKGLSATAAYPKPQAKTGGGDNGACEPPCSRLE